MINAADPQHYRPRRSARQPVQRSRSRPAFPAARPRRAAQTIRLLYVTRFLSFTGARTAASRAATTARKAWSAGSTSIPARTNINGYSAGRGHHASRPRLTGFHDGFERRRRAGQYSRLPQSDAEHRDPRQQGLHAQHRRFARCARWSSTVDTQAFVTMLDGVGTNNQQRWRLAQPASRRAQSRSRQEEAVLFQSVGDRLHHASGRRQRLCGVGRQRPAGQAQRQCQQSCRALPSIDDTTRYIDLNDPETRRPRRQGRQESGRNRHQFRPAPGPGLPISFPAMSRSSISTPTR